MSLEWTFPKGIIEADESKEEAAHREILEETGYDVTLTSIVVGSNEYNYVYRGLYWKKRVIYYLGTYNNYIATLPIISDANEVDECRWVDVASAKNLLTYEEDRNFLIRALLEFVRIRPRAE